MTNLDEKTGPGHAETGGETAPRGAKTRDRLLDAGLRLYAEHGLEAVSTRALAQQAGVNLAAIGYHFGGKQELYDAVLHQLIKETEPLVGPAIARLREGIAATHGDKTALALIAREFISGLLRALVSGERAKSRAAMILREYTRPTPSFSILYEGRLRPLHEAVTDLVAEATGTPPDDPGNIIRAHSVLGQVIVFAVAREILFRRLDWDSYSPSRIDTVTATVTRSVLASLDLPYPPTHGQRP